MPSFLLLCRETEIKQLQGWRGTIENLLGQFPEVIAALELATAAAAAAAAAAPKPAVSANEGEGNSASGSGAAAAAAAAISAGAQEGEKGGLDVEEAGGALERERELREDQVSSLMAQLQKLHRHFQQVRLGLRQGRCWRFEDRRGG